MKQVTPKKTPARGGGALRLPVATGGLIREDNVQQHPREGFSYPCNGLERGHSHNVGAILKKSAANENAPVPLNMQLRSSIEG